MSQPPEERVLNWLNEKENFESMKVKIFYRSLAAAICLGLATFSVACSSKPSQKELQELARKHAQQCAWNLDGKLYTHGWLLGADKLNLNVMNVTYKNGKAEVTIYVMPELSLDLGKPQPGKSWLYSGQWKIKRSGFRWVIDEPEGTIVPMSLGVKF